MDVLLNINFGKAFLLISVFSYNDLKLLTDIVCRIPLYSSSKDQNSMIFHLLKAIEKEFSIDLLEHTATKETIEFLPNVKKTIFTGEIIPNNLRHLASFKDDYKEGVFVNKSRLVINWEFDRIEFIFGEKGYLNFSLNYENIIKYPKLKNLLSTLKISQDKFKNFERSFPLFFQKSAFIELFFFGLIFEEIAKILKIENKNWDKHLNEIILTGEYISVRQDNYQLVHFIGSAMGLLGIFDFYLDNYNFFDSIGFEYFRDTADAYNYLYIPKAVRKYKHTLISEKGKSRNEIFVEDNKIRVIDTSEVDSLEIHLGDNVKKKDVDLNGNYIFVDTRNFDYQEQINLFVKSKKKITELLAEWDNGSFIKKTGSTSKIVNYHLSRFIFDRSEFKKNINKHFSLKVKKDEIINENTELGIYSRKIIIFNLDLVSTLGVKKDFEKYVSVVEGQMVKMGDVLALNPSVFGVGSKSLLSPEIGKIGLSKVKDGFIELHVLTNNNIEKSNINGIVKSIIPNSLIKFEANTIRLNLFNSTGKSGFGELLIDFRNKDLNNKILFLQNYRIDFINIRKLIQLGLRGVIFDSIPSVEWDLLETWLKNSGIHFFIGIFERYGTKSIDDEIIKKIKKFEGGQVFLSVLNNSMNIFVNGEVKFHSEEQHQNSVRKLRHGDIITLRNYKNWGETAEVLTKIQDNCIVKLINSEAENISLYNIE